MFEWIRSRFRIAGQASGSATSDGAGSGRQYLLERARAFHDQGATDQARQCCLAILRHSPDDVRALCLLAEIAADARRTEEGLQWAQHAIAVDPRSASAHYLAGRLLQDAGRLKEAESSYRAVLRLRPDYAKAHNNLGSVLHMQGKLEEALACYRRALDLDPSQPEAIQNYASLTRDPEVLAQAIEGYLRQTRANPNDAVAFTNLANTYRELGRYREALESFERAIAADPDNAEAHFSRSFVLLLCGDYAQGWREYEWRWRISAFNAPLREFPEAMWDGREIADGAILLNAEAGFGDTLQFVRYAPLVAERCSSVILRCPAELSSLMKAVKGVGAVVSHREALPPYAAHLPMMSLPKVFGTTLQNVPWTGPYVHADPERAAAWRPLVEADAGQLKAGLVWAGRPQQWDDRKRSITLDLLAPLARIAGVIFYSLQKGEAAAQASSPPKGMKLVDLTARIQDFSDTAALVSHLDLVITIDTSVAHLAGAMGVPTWVLVAHAPDWRYHLERSDNPWYPTMRLYRQDRDGDWAGPIARVAEMLKEETLIAKNARKTKEGN